MLASTLALSTQNSFALIPQEVLVVYNTASSIQEASEGTARYYATQRGIPSDNVIGISTGTSDQVSGTTYVNTIATPIWNMDCTPSSGHSVNSII
jgi:hypothetical protein